MGALISLAKSVKQWFTGTPDEYNPTNDHIRKYHEMQDGRETPTSGTDPFPTPEDRDIPTSPSPTPFNADDTHFSPPSKSLSLTRSQTSQVQKYLHQAEFYLENGPIQPEVWPTKEEFQSAKKRIQYDPKKFHFAVCGGSGAGKSSLINAFRGLKNSSPQAAHTGVDETTMVITRYPDPREELPYKRFVWYDCPGAGTLKTPSWKYFNQQGLFIFDIIILVYATRFTEVDVSVIQNCERFKIPLYIVRSKSDIDIKNIIEDLRDKKNDDDSESDSDDRDNVNDYQTQARQQLIDSTKKSVERNLKEARLANRDVFIVSRHVIFSLVTAKGHKKIPPAIDEVRLMETIMMSAYARRYGNQAADIEDHLLTNSSPLALTWH